MCTALDVLGVQAEEEPLSLFVMRMKVSICVVSRR